MDRGDRQPADVSVDRLTMAEAAKRLGVTKDAIRKRVQRGNLPYEKDSDGVIHVYLDAGDSHPGTGGQTSTDADPRTLRWYLKQLWTYYKTRSNSLGRSWSVRTLSLCP